jgi:hypothetical protein
MGVGRWVIFLLAAAALTGARAEARNVGYPSDWSLFSFMTPEGLAHPKDRLKLVWSDEFDQLKLARPSQLLPGTREAPKWFAPVAAPLGSGPLAVPPDPSAFQLGEGVLRLHMDSRAGKWVGVNLQTFDPTTNRGLTFQNGYVEIRAKLPRSTGAHTGLWLRSNETGQGHAEIDLAETYGAADNNHLHSTVHVARPGQKRIWNSHIVDVPDLYDRFHLFGAWLTDDWISIFVDDRLVGRIARLPEQKKPVYILMSIFDHDHDGPPVPSSMEIDFVRVWR